jgi:hypothetical protein
MPFTSTLLGAFVRNPLAVDIFALNLLLASLATQAMIVVGRRKGLLISDARARSGRINAAVVPIVMAVSIGVSWWSTAAAKYLWILMAVAAGLISRWSARRDRGYSTDIPNGKRQCGSRSCTCRTARAPKPWDAHLRPPSAAVLRGDRQHRRAAG